MRTLKEIRRFVHYFPESLKKLEGLLFHMEKHFPYYAPDKANVFMQATIQIKDLVAYSEKVRERTTGREVVPLMNSEIDEFKQRSLNVYQAFDRCFENEEDKKIGRQYLEAVEKAF